MEPQRHAFERSSLATGPQINLCKHCGQGVQEHESVIIIGGERMTTAEFTRRFPPQTLYMTGERP